MSEALRDTEGKLDWAMLFEYFPLAFPELCRAREFGARHYTKDGKDGRSNWRDSINTEKHEEFMKGGVRGDISHSFKFLWGEQRDVAQDNVHHMAYAALNALMALEYDLSQGEDQMTLERIGNDCGELQDDVKVVNKNLRDGEDWTTTLEGRQTSSKNLQPKGVKSDTHRVSSSATLSGGKNVYGIP